MSTTVPVPKSCLVAVLLVCQTRSGSGPQLVYHWPPDPLTQHSNSTQQQDGFENDDSSNDSEDWSSSDDDHHYFDNHRDNPTAGGHVSVASNGSNSLDRSTSKLDQQQDTSHSVKRNLLGLDEDGLISLLAPERTWNKRKFELSINELTFLGRPVFARHDGSWQRQKKSQAAVKKPDSSDADRSTEDEEVANPIDGLADLRKSDETLQVKSELTMFHIVFVMNPPQLDHTYRVKEMYDNVVKKFSRALKWVQAKNDYVWQQADGLLTRKQQLLKQSDRSCSSVASELLDSSTLAKAMKTLYNAISVSRIASVSLLPGVSISLQIPPTTSTAYLPSLTEPPLPPGLWLTTANEASSKAAANERHTETTPAQMTKSFTLLLKSPPHRIKQDALTAGGPLASHLPRFVAALKPTKSFYKLSTEYKISLPDVQLLARHLIYWRRAVLIPPLNQRDTYIVSPNANFRLIRQACKSYESQFPAPMPSLPKLLADLSGTPRPFGTLIPSPDHKDDYMLVLAWLMRNGWVTQLRTFAYVRIDTETKRRARERDRETKTPISQSYNSASDTNERRMTSASGISRPSFVSRQSSDGRQSLKNGKSLRGASMIKSPQKATSEESRWLTYLHDSMLDDEGVFAGLTDEEKAELYRYWPTFSKYFDGTTALESIPIREGLKRKLAWDLYGKLGLNFDRGVEDDEGTNQSFIVAIRHW